MFKGVVRNRLWKIIDFFYPPFAKIINVQTFRYIVCGGSNAVLNLSIFSFSYNFIFDKEVVYLFDIPIKRYIASYLAALSFSFPIGFLLNKYVVFQYSSLKGSTQLFRYGSLICTNIFLDYALLHLLIGYFGFWPTLSQAFIIVLLSLLSYFYQTYFSFKTEKS